MARIINKNTGRVLAEKNSDKQELWCHECESYVQFPIDLTMNGNHVLNCPNCGHEHCRVVRDGRITSTRWDSRNGARISIASYAAATTATQSILSYSSYATGWGMTTTTATGYTAYT